MNSAARQAWQLMADVLWSDDSHQRFHEACRTVDVTPPMLKALLLLDAGQAVPMRAFAEHLQCDASWVTSLVDGLEERGFVERRPLVGDRRVKTVVLTEDGVLAKKRALEVLHEPPASFAKLTPAEARRLRDLLRKACGR